MKRWQLLSLIVLTLIAAAAFWLWTPDKSLADLEAQYFSGDSEYREVLGVRLHIRDTGPEDARAILMLHGFGSSLHTWEGWARGLDDRFRAIRLDLPGSGLSSPDPTADYSDERTLQILSALLEQLGIESATVAGNSIGGRMAWKMAALRPEQVAALVLVSPDGYASEGFEYGKAPEVSAVTGLMRYVLPRSLLEMSLAPAYGDSSKLRSEVVDRYYDLMLAPDSRQAQIHRMEQTLLVDPKPLLASINVPVLLLWGEEDGVIPISNAEDYLGVLPDARLVSLPGLGHVPQEEDPGASARPVREFLQGL